ncbi:MAG: sulfite exporter TauE/SafE family protein [Pseudomonadota bacterium]
MELFTEQGNLQQLALCCAVVFVAAIAQMSVGMGFGMLASPVIALIKPEIVPGAIMIIGLFVALSGAWRERANISPDDLKLGIGGRVAGSFTALLIITEISDLDAFFILFGTIMLIAIVLTAIKPRLEFNPSNLFGLSIISGLMGTITAVGAPPMALIYHSQKPEIVRPTLNAFFASGCLLGLASLAMAGWLDLQDLVFTTLLVPAMLAGIGFSRYLMNLPAGFVSHALLVLSASASILLIVRGLS